MTDAEKKKLLKEFREKFYECFMRTDSGAHTVDKEIESFLLSKVAEAKEEAKKRLIKEYKPILNDMYATDWLRNDYGLSDDDTLNAGEVEELLESFISQHSEIREQVAEKGKS